MSKFPNLKNYGATAEVFAKNAHRFLKALNGGGQQNKVSGGGEVSKKNVAIDMDDLDYGEPIKTRLSGVLFVVEALRFGDRENHSYVVGVYTSAEKANNAAAIEENWRGVGKYECSIHCMVLDSVRQEKADYHRQCVESVGDVQN